MFEPLSDKVLVSLQTEEKSAGGIILQNVTPVLRKGTVIAAGPGEINLAGQLVPTSVKPGDLVYFGPQTGVEVKVDGETVWLMREGDLLGVKRAAR